MVAPEIIVAAARVYMLPGSCVGFKSMIKTFIKFTLHVYKQVWQQIFTRIIYSPL